MLRLTRGTDTIGTPGFALLEQMRLSQNKRADISEEICQSHPGVGNHLLLIHGRRGDRVNSEVFTPM